MQLRALVLTLALAACRTPRNEPTPDAAPADAATARDASADAATTLRDVDAGVAPRACAPPSKIVQLQTLRGEDITWAHDLVFDGKRYYEPEALTEVPAPARSAPRTELDAGDSRWQAKLHKGESLLRIESGRWVVVECADSTLNGVKDAHAERVIDATTGKEDPRRWITVEGDHALMASSDDPSVVVWDLAKNVEMLRANPCAAGGMWEWALLGDFLICGSN